MSYLYYVAGNSFPRSFTCKVYLNIPCVARLSLSEGVTGGAAAPVSFRSSNVSDQKRQKEQAYFGLLLFKSAAPGSHWGRDFFESIKGNDGCFYITALVSHTWVKAVSSSVANFRSIADNIFFQKPFNCFSNAWLVHVQFFRNLFLRDAEIISKSSLAIKCSKTLYCSCGSFCSANHSIAC